MFKWVLNKIEKNNYLIFAIRPILYLANIVRIILYNLWH